MGVKNVNNHLEDVETSVVVGNIYYDNSDRLVAYSSNYNLNDYPTFSQMPTQLKNPFNLKNYRRRKRKYFL